jgi:hypothetical protein
MMLSLQDNCFLIGSLTTLESFPYNTGFFSVKHVTGTIFLSSTGAEHHLLNANGFVMSSFLFLISVEQLQAHLEVASVSHALWNEMASYFWSFSDRMQTSEPHRPSSFLRYFTSVEMVIFFIALAVLAAHARF